MEEKLIYISYGENAVIYNSENGTFSARLTGVGEVIKNASLVLKKPDGKIIDIKNFKSYHHNREFNIENNELNISYQYGEEKGFCPEIGFRLNNDGIRITVLGVKDCIAAIEGEAFFGEDMGNDTFAMCMERSGLDLRCAVGPATSEIDNALFDRKNDRALLIEGGKKIRYKFNWEKGCYDFKLTFGEVAFQQKFDISIKKDILKEKYNVNFSPINKNATFKKPPAGWMTWYAVKFNASEETVLENVKFQTEHLKKYGADAVWIDWEWYHNNLNGVRDDGVNTFVPDSKMYPNGLKYISDEIKKAGFTPALWVGFTHDSSRNEFTKEHPEIILAENEEWCGREFYDFSHPLYLEEFLPKALKQVKDWGYEAIKFDTLPIAIEYHEKHHMNMYDPTLSTKEAFLKAMKKTREVLGNDMYMLSCAAIKDADFLWAADIFDAGRVGNDIFEWEEFIKEGVERTLKFYPLHNILIYPDPDNVVLREEFNTINQAESRIYFVAFLGLPMTFGDDFKVLSKERVDLIKQCLPVMDVHPMDINEPVRDPGEMIINLLIENPYESYNVVNVFNVNKKDTVRRVNITSDLHLEDGEYHIFDFKNKKYLGAVKDFFEVKAGPCQSNIFCVRKKLTIPQIISTSRHISQGAVEIEDLTQNEEFIKFTSKLIANDSYKVYIYIPDGFKLKEEYEKTAVKTDENVYCFEYLKDLDGSYDFRIDFEKIN